MQTRYQKARRDCPICLEPITNQAVLDQCNHLFCADCITRWAKNENSCPLCKRRFTQISTIHLRPNYTGRKRHVIRHRVQRKSQYESDPFLLAYVDSLQSHQFLSIDQDVQFLSFLLSLQQELDQL